MNLVIDIGNTTTHFGLFQGDRLIKSFKIKTKEPKLLFLIKKNLETIPEKIIICSVVPNETIRLEKILKQIFKTSPVVVGRDLIVPIKNLYRKPKQVGQDRLVNAYAGIELYGAPLIVVDFGTAITFDIISKNKEYLGGIILPGLNLSLDSLNQKTALLPKVKLAKPKEFIGRDTKQSILSGIVYGFSALTDSLVEKIKLDSRLPSGKAAGFRGKVIATGGNAQLIADYCSSIEKIEENLILKGLNLLAKSKKVCYI